MSSEIKTEALNLLKSKIGEDATLDFFDICETKEKMSSFVKIFKVLFASDYKIILWNSMLDSNVDFSLLNCDDFSDDEWAFIEEANETKQRLLKKDKKIYNVNGEIVSHAIRLIPIADEHLAATKEYFKNETDEFLEYSTAKFDDLGFKITFELQNELMFAIYTGEKMVGIVSLEQMEDFACLYNVAYFVFKNYRGNGYATNAIKALINYAFGGKLIIEVDSGWRGITETRSLDVEVIELKTAKHNIASQRVAEKLGFSFDGRRRRGWRVDSTKEYDDMLFYSIENTDKRCN